MPYYCLVEPAATNLALYASDFTNAAWTKSNLTTALTATGPDGVANSASTLTATAGNATALQAITSASASRITSVFIKRRTGAGNIDVTQDNGSTWATQAVTSSWTRFSLAAATAADPTVGIRIVTSGDAVDVWVFQHELSAVTSPVPTFAATVTRAADNINVATSAFPLGSAYSILMKAMMPANQNGLSLLSISDGTTNNDVEIYSANAPIHFQVLSGGVGQADITVGNQTAGTAFALAGRAVANDFHAAINGVLAGTPDTSGSMPVSPTILRLKAASGSSDARFKLSQLVVVPRGWTNTELTTRAAAP